MQYLKITRFLEADFYAQYSFVEVNEERLGTRIVEVYFDGTMYWADEETGDDAKVYLCGCPWPTLEELAADPEYGIEGDGIEIPKHEFEEIWLKARSVGV